MFLYLLKITLQKKCFEHINSTFLNIPLRKVANMYLLLYHQFWINTTLWWFGLSYDALVILNDRNSTLRAGNWWIYEYIWEHSAFVEEIMSCESEIS